MKSLSIAGKDTHTDEHVVGYCNAGDRMKRWGKVGAFWGGFWGLLFGSGLFLIPGLGPILIAGPLVAWIIAGLEGAVVVGGVTALGAGLVSIGVATPAFLAHMRKQAIVAIFILSAFIAPSADPVTQTIVAVPLIVLYEMGIWMSYFAVRRK